MGALWAIQFVVTAVCCAFYFCASNCDIDPARRLITIFRPPLAVPLKPGQGCIAGPRHTWVGIYWVAPTLLYTASVSSPFFHFPAYDIPGAHLSSLVRSRAPSLDQVPRSQAAQPLETDAS